MAKKPREEGASNEWMNTYSDLVTLLMCFFVLLFSMSSVDAEKWELLVEALAGSDETKLVVDPSANPGDDMPPGNPGQGGEGLTVAPVSGDPKDLQDFDELFDFLQKYLEEKGLSESIEVMKSGDNVVYIRFRNSIFFQPDKGNLLNEAKEILNYLGECLVAVEDQIYVVSINGHTADVQTPGVYVVSDWLLSGERASQVAKYLDEEMHFTPSKLRPMGYGKNFPIADNTTPEGREQNRRVDMTIVRDTGSTGDVEQQLASLFDPAQFPKTGGATDLFSPEA